MDMYSMIEQGNANPLFLVAAASVLGALHGLEPGHSKTMIAAFIIAVRGTVMQAVVLGLSAVVSHSLIVWVLGLLVLTYGDEMIAEEMEPWFIMASGVIILCIALWMAWRIYRDRKARRTHAHEHHHGGEAAGHRHHSHDDDHHHDRLPQDAHARAHAMDIEKRFASGRATTGQVIWFGLTGGLIPCPAAVTVLIVCLHLNHFWLGVGLVASFSIGLALTLVTVGVVAAWGVSFARRKSSRFEALFSAAPYISVVVIGLLGLLMLYSGFSHISASGHTPVFH